LFDNKVFENHFFEKIRKARGRPNSILTWPDKPDLTQLRLKYPTQRILDACRIFPLFQIYYKFISNIHYFKTHTLLTLNYDRKKIARNKVFPRSSQSSVHQFFLHSASTLISLIK
jgi:hypothetical protein